MLLVLNKPLKRTLWALGLSLVCATSAQAIEPGKRQAKIAATMGEFYKLRLACDQPAQVTIIQGSQQIWLSETAWGYQVNVCDHTVLVGTYTSNYYQYVDDLTLRKRVPLEWSCHAKDLTWTYVDVHTRIVRGCGQQATFVSSGRTWIANTSGDDRSTPAASD